MRLDFLHSDLRDNVIIKRLEALPEEEKAAAAIKLLGIYDDPYGHIPRARVGLTWNGWIEPYDKEDFRDRAYYVRSFFSYLLSLNLARYERKWLEKRFLRQMYEDQRKTERIYEQKKATLRGIRDLPHHLIPPYLYDWKESILGHDNDRSEEMGILMDYNFTKYILGRGSYAFVYLVIGPDGKKYALKIFYPRWKYPLEDWDGVKSRDKTNRKIVQNVASLRGMLDQFPKFPKIKTPLSGGRRVAEEPWYMMDFIAGKNVGQLLLDKTKPSDSLKKTVSAEYANMLKFLHSRGMIFLDNGWGSAIVTQKNNVRFIDFDFITREGEKPVVWARKYKYGPEELLHLPDEIKEDDDKWKRPVKSTDLESFAKMLDHLYVGNVWIRNDEELARFRKNPVYPERRKKKLPTSLRYPVGQMISKPRDESITIDDFIEAIEKINT